jgi:hypothetical protein
MDFDAAKGLCRTFPGCTKDIKWRVPNGCTSAHRRT